MRFTDFHDDLNWRHLQDELDAKRPYDTPQRKPFCIRCGMRIELSKHGDATYEFDFGTERLHASTCRYP